MASRPEIWIDRGGTFTDCVWRNPRTGAFEAVKVLSTDDAPLQGIRRLLGLGRDDPLPPCDLRMGTTVATNALLERRGVPVLLVITRGFGDLVTIGTQARPDLFDLAIDKPAPIHREVLEVNARHDAGGRVIARPDAAVVRGKLAEVKARGIDSVAMVVINAHRNPDLELELGALARAEGFRHVALSHQVACELGLLARADTTLLDAYLTPLLRDYVAELERELGGGSLRLMESSGTLTDAARFRGPGALLSGPAGGVVALAHVARQAGLSSVIGLDMGGTSTDVSRFGGEFERVYESPIAGVRVRTPSLRVVTVAAGGGSLCRFDGRRLVVGPESAGSDPGPLCYGNPDACELTVTDVNLVLGRLVPDRFPLPLDQQRPRDALRALSAALGSDPGAPARDVEELAESFFQIACNNMAEAIRRVSVARGFDPRDHGLVVFGGAGGQHACALARSLGMSRVVFHPLAGVLSAWGMGLADVAWHGRADAGGAILSAEALAPLGEQAERLEADGRTVLRQEGYADDRIRAHRRLELRYSGTDSSVVVDWECVEGLRRAVDEAHERHFGYRRGDSQVEVATVRVEVAAQGRAPEGAAIAAQRGEPRRVRSARLRVGGKTLEDVPVYHREALGAGTHLGGPALVLDTTGTLVIEPGFEFSVDAHGTLIAEDCERPASAAALELLPRADESSPDPMMLEILGHAFMSIAEQMGEALKRTAISTNIRERLDFSCAVFDASGQLVANAPHIPVHLGAMGESVLAVVAAHPTLEPGDVFVTNDPAAGGSHLPDITVVTPVHDASGRLLFFTASRGHHADVGGITPGSMPPFSSSLSEEGVVFRCQRAVSGGDIDRAGLLRTLTSSPFPARDPSTNLADLEAQIAANRTGARLLLELAQSYGLARVQRYMRFVQDDAAGRVEDEILRLGDGERRFEDAMDDGTPVVVTLTTRGRRMVIDFSGTGPESATNLNAPRAVVVAAVIYFLRSLVGAAIPLNAGCLRPVELVIPEGCLLNPSPGAAVAGGNVETSQRIVDVLLAAAGRAAASQGTMNNLTFGSDRFGYYETIAGGAGAGPNFAGASAVHTHMTNTRITDPEVLEARAPVRVLRFAVRADSGGAGRFAGGDGIVRELEFLDAVDGAVLSERRERAPFGLAGGEAARPGANFLDDVPLGGKATFRAHAGSVLRIETPGGGGYGSPETGG